MIHHKIVWSSDKNIAEAYNKAFEGVGKDDWVCFLDGDAVHTTSYFGSRIEEVIKANPECEFFTCVTNRVACKWQLYGQWGSDDMRHHRELGETLWNTYGTKCIDVTKLQPMSGVLMLVKKTLWDVIKFRGKILGVDNNFHKDVQANGKKLYLMQGIYVYHWYRGGDIHNRKHLE